MEDLELRHGETVTAAHINALDRAIARNAARPVPVGVRRSFHPSGTTHCYSRVINVVSAPVFEPEVTTVDADTATVSWLGPHARIGGVYPTMSDEVTISLEEGVTFTGSNVVIFTEDSETGERPALLVTRSAFNEKGDCGIYFRVEVDANFNVLNVHPVALPPLPTPTPFIAYRLALFLRLRDGVITYEAERDRVLFSAQGFFAAVRRANGLFQPLFWSET